MKRPETTFCYALCDPGTDPSAPPEALRAVRYVGKADDPLRRAKAHQKPSDSATNPYKARWIEQLRRQGLAPVLVILEECPYDAWQSRELYWHDFFVLRGERLTNLATCGQGDSPLAATPEVSRRRRRLRRT